MCKLLFFLTNSFLILKINYRTLKQKKEMNIMDKGNVINFTIRRLEKNPPNNLSEEELRDAIKNTNFGWGNGTESWPSDS